MVLYNLEPPSCLLPQINIDWLQLGSKFECLIRSDHVLMLRH